MVRIWPKNFGFETWHLAGQTVAQCLGTVIYTLLVMVQFLKVPVHGNKNNFQNR